MFWAKSPDSSGRAPHANCAECGKEFGLFLPKLQCPSCNRAVCRVRSCRNHIGTDSLTWRAAVPPFPPLLSPCSFARHMIL